jgi:hypothetical protein
MSDNNETHAREYDDSEYIHFGKCPGCHAASQPDAAVNYNIGRTHWFACAEHRVCWCVGSNLFSGWKEETPEQWEANAAFLNTCEKIEPVMNSPEFYDLDHSQQDKAANLERLLND